MTPLYRVPIYGELGRCIEMISVKGTPWGTPYSIQTFHMLTYRLEQNRLAIRLGYLCGLSYRARV